jgi:hypothetical protein
MWTYEIGNWGILYDKIPYFYSSAAQTHKKNVG